MMARHGDDLRRRVDGGDFRAQPGQRLGEQSCSRAHIQRSPARKGLAVMFVELPVMVDLVAYIAEAHRVHLVEQRRRASRVPPFGRHLPEMGRFLGVDGRSEEHTSELQSLMRISYAVFCLNKKTHIQTT